MQYPSEFIVFHERYDWHGDHVGLRPSLANSPKARFNAACFDGHAKLLRPHAFRTDGVHDPNCTFGTPGRT